MVKALIDEDEDTFDENGVILLPDYEVTKSRYDWTKNFQSASFRWDFEGEKPAKSIIVGGLFQINADVVDDISFKTEGGPHNDKNAECGRCNDIGISFDGKTLRYRVEKSHPDYTNDLYKKNINIGDLRKKWVGYQLVSQEVTFKDNSGEDGVQGRRIRLYVDTNAKKEDGTLNNNYVQVGDDIINIGQYSDGGEPVPIVNESPCKESQTTIRIDKLRESQIKYEKLFLRNIEADTEIKNPDPGDIKIPPKVIVVPEVTVKEAGETVLIDASKSEDPDGEIDCFIFKQVKPWLVGQRLGLKPMTGTDMGKINVTYPVLEKKPQKPLQLEVTVRDTDQLEKSQIVTFKDEIDYQAASGQLRTKLIIDPLNYEIEQTQFPLRVPIQVVTTGGKPPYTIGVMAQSDHGATMISDPTQRVLQVNEPDKVIITLNITDMEGKKASDTKTVSVSLKGTAPPVEGKLDKDGILIPFQTTGKTVTLDSGKDHRNGQRWSVNHKFLNYMEIGYHQIGKGQETLEMKTDGPNHGSCTKLPMCCWVECDLSLTDRTVTNDGITRKYKAGQFYFSSEYPHPKNHVAALEAIGPVLEKVPKAGDWVGWSVSAFQDKASGYRRYQIRFDSDPFDSNGKPKNNWKVQMDMIDDGKLTNKDLCKREIPVTYNKGLEAEIRCHGGTNHDCKIKFAKIIEIVPP